jgi:hypothetical protein
MDGPVTFEDLVAKCIKEVLVDSFSERPRSRNGKFPWMTTDMLAEYYARAMCFSVKVWIRQGMSVPPQEMADFYEYIMTHNMEETLAEI